MRIAHDLLIAQPKNTCSIWDKTLTLIRINILSNIMNVCFIFPYESLCQQDNISNVHNQPIKIIEESMLVSLKTFWTSLIQASLAEEERVLITKNKKLGKRLAFQ